MKCEEIPIVERLERKVQALPAQGGGFIGTDSKGRTTFGSYITDDGKRLANPDGPEAAAIIKGLAEALKFVEPFIKVGGVTRIERTAARVKIRAALTRAQVQS